MNTPRTKDEVNAILEGINAPYKGGHLSTLGGAERASILLVVSLDAKETWQNGILENSNYLRLHFLSDGELAMFSGYLPKGVKNFRKTKAKDVGEAIAKINKFLDKVRESL